MARVSKPKSPEIERLLSVMAALDETPDSLAERTNVSARTINNYIWGDQPLGGHLLRALRVHCDVSIDWLLSGQGDMYADAPLVRQPTKRLIPKRAEDEVDLKKAGDYWWHCAYLAEQVLIDCSAVADADYTLLDLLTLAQPLLVANVQAGETVPWLIGAVVPGKK